VPAELKAEQATEGWKSISRVPASMSGDDGSWARGREALRTADPRMAELIDADPGLDPDAVFDSWPSDLWGALVLQVIGQQLSRAAADAILGRLEALYGSQLPTPTELLDTDAVTLRRIGLSRAKADYLHDLAARLEDGRLDLKRPFARATPNRGRRRVRRADPRAGDGSLRLSLGKLSQSLP
jgi:3-methyladenine DNA glycosylase/8-oxoguanine DNA glycosylase